MTLTPGVPNSFTNVSFFVFIQTSAFLRNKTQTGAEVLNPQQNKQELFSQDADLGHTEAPSGESGHGSESNMEVSSTDSDTVLHKLRSELQEERENSQRISAELAEEMEKHRHVLSLLEAEKKDREEERKERETQVQDLQTQLDLVQTQCLELQQYKAEKEKLNGEVLELKKRLQELEDAERRFSEEAASSSLSLLEEERRRQEQEMQRIREEHQEEMERARKQWEESETELKFREEEEVMGLKASKNRQNQSKASFGLEEPSLEGGLDQFNINESITGDILMERYLSSVPCARSQSSVINESFEQEASAEHR